jgi:aerobic carbon-monoxide dehydrogenase large subunit
MKFGIGQAVRRTEDVRFVTGNGQYADDISFPGMAHCLIVRSPVAHATINSIDIDEARAVDGVLDVVVEADLAAEGYAYIRCLAGTINRDGERLPQTKQWLLAKDKVRYVGHPVAAIIAESIAAAREAAELVYVDYDMHEAVANVDEARADGAPQLWDTIPGNRSLDWETGDKEATEAAFVKADHVVSLNVTQNRIVVNSMEPRGSIGQYDAARDQYTLHVSCQGVHGAQQRLARGIMKIDPEKLRVIAPDVGGGFGMKGFSFPEECIALYAAKKLGRPVKWIGDRSEAFQADTHGRDVRSEGSLAFDKGGKILGFKLKNRANLGAYNSIFGPGVATSAGSRVFGGCYKIDAIYAEIEGYLTNTAPVDAYRGAGRPEAAYFIERLMDEAGRITGLGPIEIRKRNFITPSQMPYENKTGISYDTGDFDVVMDDALSTADFESFPERKAASKARGKLRGFGLSYYIEVTGAGREMSRIRFTDNGGVQVTVGTQSNGQGHETAFAQVAAEKLGLPFESIEILQGDTDGQPFGGGTGGARSAIAASGAIGAAVDLVVEQGKKIAGHLLDVDPGKINFDASSGVGTFSTSEGGKNVGLAEVVQTGLTGRDKLPVNLATELVDGYDVTADNEIPSGSFANGCHICEVEIDEDTGKVQVVDYKVVDDFGTIINPLIVEGQVQGGIAQGLGQALLEDCVYEEGGSGQLVTGSFMDYAMPRADDMPPVSFRSVEDIPCTNNAMGIKGCGEAGTVGSLPSVVNAVVDALSHLGINNVEMPCTPEKVWQLMNDARSA